LTLNGLHGVISQKMILFITTAVRTSNPKYNLLLLTKSPRSQLNTRTWTSHATLYTETSVEIRQLANYSADCLYR
jgi:hypothetical protein